MNNCDGQSISRRHVLATLAWLACGQTSHGLAQTASPPIASSSTRTIIVASTTSIQDSGLFEHILPFFTAKTGITARVIAQGTGQALDTARRGDADVAFVHARALEEKFVADGFGVERKPVMYNDFVLIGPASDPAGVAGTKDIALALKAISDRNLPFVSRGDRSGTHAAELNLWKLAGVNLAAVRGSWYREIGQGMGAALNTASAMEAYVLADRGTWISFKNRGNLALMIAGDKRLFNQYGVILVNPTRHPTVKAGDGQAFIDWLTGPDGQKAISDYKIDGEQVFFPNAATPGA